MSVFRSLSLSYEGREYTVTPSNRTLRLIEAKGKRDVPTFSLTRVVYDAISGGGGPYDLAFILSELVNASGGKTTEDEALAWLSSLDAKALQDAQDFIVQCLMPDDTRKKPEAP